MPEYEMKNLSVFFFLFYSTITFSQNVDINILKKINLGRNKNMDNTFIFISNSITPVSVLTPVSVFFEGYSSHDSLLKNRGLYIGASLLLSTGITLGLKYTVNRPRPFVTYPEIENITHVGSKSFPSGHTSTAFSTATSLSFAFPKWYVIAPSFAWACAVGYSRMDLGVHYPSDVIGGALIGAGSAFVCYKANNWLHKRKAGKII